MKISITGTAYSGKTVFLASLIWNLDSGDHSLVARGSFRDLPGRNGRGPTAFNFEKFRNSLAQDAVWPEKTTDTLTYDASFLRTDKKHLLPWPGRKLRNKRQHLQFFDFAGERIADAAIVANASFEDWSDHLLSHFDNHKAYREAVAPYLEQQAQLLSGGSGLDTEKAYADCIASYKLTLGRLIKNFQPLVSPSTFLLSQDGSPAPDASPEQLVQLRYAGLGFGREFAPLTSELRMRIPELTRKMARHYNAYRKQIALPVFKHIGESDKLVILIDIPALLAGGVGRYNDTRQIFLDLFETLRPDSSIGAKLTRLFTFWRGGLKTILFVAAKADMVHPDAINDGSFKSLLQEMMRRARASLPEVAMEYYVCSAIRSTRPGDAPQTLIGRPARNNPEKKEVEFQVSPIPDSWPGSWQAGDFRFSKVLPDVPKSYTSKPSDLGMDRLITALIDD